MRVLFFGTSPFALPTLQALHDAAPRHEVLAVVTQPDRPSGRGLKMHFSPVKELALALDYPVLQPERVRRKSFLAEVIPYCPDALVVVSFGQIISQALLDLPDMAGVNVHASLLPRWRGAAPIHHAIIAGDAKTGVATMQMEASLDTGPVFRIAEMPIHPDDTTETLEPRLAALGGPLLVATLDALESGAAFLTRQSEEGMTYASPVTRTDGLLDPAQQSAVEMSRRIRGTYPRPGAYVEIAGKVVRVLDAEPRADEFGEGDPAGAIRTTKAGLTIRAAENSSLFVTRLQPENKGPMSAAEWARGARLTQGATASKPDA